MAWRGKKKTPPGRNRPAVNRPLGGGTSNNVYSYYNTSQAARGSTPSEKTIDLSKAGSRLRLAPTIIALVIIVGSLLFSMTLTANPSVSTLNDQPSPYRELSVYADEAAKIMNQKLGNKTKLSINTTEIEKTLLERFPELKAAVLRLPVIGRRPNLVLDIKSPALLLATPGKSLVLDSYGIVISEVQDLTEESRQGLLVIQDQSGLPVGVGDQAVTSSTISFIQMVVAQLKAQNLEVEQLTLPQSANQLDIRLKGVPYYVKTNVGGDARLQTGSYLAVKDELAKQGITPAEYVDVRVEEKVFYR